MGEQLEVEEVTFIWWQKIHEPQLFVSAQYHLPVEVLKHLNGVKKSQFLKACELLWGQGQLRNLLCPRSPELKGR
jgi:hypothetical protein